MSLAGFDALAEDEQALWIAEWESERGKCKECGLPRAVCGDHTATLYPYRAVCYASMERAAAIAAYEALHEKEPYHNGTFSDWSKDRDADHPYHYRDGVTFGVAETDRAPHDRFTTDPDASPVPEQCEET